MLFSRNSICSIGFMLLFVLVNGISREKFLNRSFHVEQCMAKIVEVIQPCSQRAVSNWNLNHSLFVPSKLSTCCANWQVYDCFIQASLDNCNLLEFQALVHNMTIDALALQKTNCSRFKYHSEECAMFNGCSIKQGFSLVVPFFVLLTILVAECIWTMNNQ